MERLLFLYRFIKFQKKFYIQVQLVSSFKKRLIILSWFMNHIYPKFQIRKKRVEISNFCLYIIWFQRKKKSRAVWLDFLNKVLFLNRWSLNSFRDRVVQKKKENRRKLSNSSTRSMIVTITVGDVNWYYESASRYYYSAFRKSFEAMSVVRLHFYLETSVDKCHYLEQSWLTYTQYFLLSTRRSISSIFPISTCVR